MEKEKRVNKEFQLRKCHIKVISFLSLKSKQRKWLLCLAKNLKYLLIDRASDRFHIVLHANKRNKFHNFHCTIVILFLFKVSSPSYAHGFSLLS